jgi:phosphoesterase RecJ-like protein
MENIEIKKQIIDKIKEYNSIIILRHTKPDGDCMGSSLGLRSILRETFPEKKIYSTGKMKADYLDFIGSEDEELNEDIYKESLIIVVDTATKDRVDYKYFTLGKEIIKIDHHIRVEDYGIINYVREDFPAACAIIVDFYLTFKDELKLNTEAAKCLFVGLVTDTGRFKYRGVSPDVLKIGAELLSKGLDIEDIYSHLYIKSKEELKLQGYILNQFKTTPNGVAYFFVSKRIQRKFKVSTEDASSLINVLDSIKDNLIWIFFIEHSDKTIRVRLRSRFIAINEIASKYSGGGHKQAAGATVYSKKELKHLLKETDELLANYKNANPEVF